MCASQDAEEPGNYHEAISSPASNEWKITMMDEIEPMKKK